MDKREQLVNYTFWLSDNAGRTKLALSFNSPCYAFALRPFTFMQPLCFCVLELMPGAVPWMPRCLWWECSTSRRPHSCSQTQLISKGHHIRDRGFQLSQHNKVARLYVRACASVFTVRPAHFHAREKSKTCEFSQESIYWGTLRVYVWRTKQKNKNPKDRSEKTRYCIFTRDLCKSSSVRLCLNTVVLWATRTQ